MKNVCQNCQANLEQDESLCDDCFATMPMNSWVTTSGNNETGEWG